MSPEFPLCLTILPHEFQSFSPRLNLRMIHFNLQGRFYFLFLSGI
jgi:hypothetical protein